MASQVYNEAKYQLLNGGYDLDTHDIRAKLLMNTTTCDTENDGIATNSNFLRPSTSAMPQAMPVWPWVAKR